ncbi:MAG: hypothetical protein MI923_09310 [Phycisphaerales bacterium]|nr:hypothetical protein [Phycisphaerales bacterium]
MNLAVETALVALDAHQQEPVEGYEPDQYSCRHRQACHDAFARVRELVESSLVVVF